MTTKVEIYNNYFSGKINEFELIVALDSIQQKTVKGDGVIYTPWDIVEEMVKVADPTDKMDIIEPSCGHGAFLIGLLNFISKKYSLTGKDLYSWFKKRVTAVEISPLTVDEVREILFAYFKKHYSLTKKPSDFNNVHCHDGLTYADNRHYNLCIGNPPYIRAKHLDSGYLKFLKNNFKSCKKGTIDIYFAFIEKYSESADSLVFITPNSFLSSNAGVVLKNSIMGKLTYLVDFKERHVFKDASVYTCIFKTTLKNQSNTLIYGTDLTNTKTIASNVLFNSSTVVNNQLTPVLSGIATLCDKVFTAQLRDDGKYYATYEKVSYEIESGLVVPYLKLTKIKSASDLAKIDYMIYPYDINKKIILESVLMTNYPLAYKYLNVVKARLNKRDKGKTEKYESWYAYGRKQGLHNITSGRILIIPQMLGGNCTPHIVDITALLSRHNQIVFTSGFIVPETSINNKSVAKVLTSSFIDYAKQHGRVWPGSTDNYYSLTTKQIARFV